MKRLEVKAVKTNKDNIIVFISKKSLGVKIKEKQSRTENNQLVDERQINQILNEKLSRLKGENSVLKNTKEILESEIERLRDFIIQEK